MYQDNGDQRIETLELKLMDLENALQQLNDVVLQQYRDIERLQLQQEELLRRSSDNQADASQPSTTDERPPHY